MDQKTMVRYRPIGPGTWQGRIDDRERFDAFRWHQWVVPIDLSDEPKRETGDLHFCFLGFQSDAGVARNKGRVGAAAGPGQIRRELGNLPCLFDPAVRLYDAGDIVDIDGDLEASQEALTDAVEILMQKGFFPVLLGGGHEIALGHYRGLRAIGEKLGIVNFDAHFDARPYPEGGTSGTMFRQIADERIQAGLDFRYLALGIQKHGNTVDLFNTITRLGGRYILARDLVHGDDFSLIERIDDYMREQDHLYVTVCADVFSSAYAPGVSAAQPLGLDPERLLKFLKIILRSGKVVAFDVAEVSPRFDQDRTTANLAAVLIFTLITTIAKQQNLGPAAIIEAPLY
jgi:formiminoglutamase